MKILIADDQPINRIVTQNFLTKKGWSVVVAQDGEQALRIVEREPIDLILMDVQMPKMDGLTSTRLIRQLPGQSAVPIIAITATDSEEDLQACASAGMTDHLRKPFSHEALYELIEHYLPPTDSIVSLPLDQSPELPGFSEPDKVFGLLKTEKLFKTFLKLFLQQYADADTALAAYETSAQQDKAERMAHGLISSAGMLGAHHLSELTRSYYTALKTVPPPPTRADLTARLLAELQVVRASIHTLLD